MLENIKIVQKYYPTKYGAVDTKAYGYEQAKNVCAFHSSFPEYSITPLASLKNLAQNLGVKNIYVKDESKRFGLNAFKVLGGSYAIAKEIAERLQLEGEKMTYKELTSPAVKEKLGELTFVTATDGNHGRGVAWTANRLGQKAVVFMPKGSSLERLHNIQALGAEASITDLNYDDAVRLANKTAQDCGGVVIQDTSWEGYEKVPQHIMQGYTTFAYEMVNQLGDVRPTHIFLQAGVGAMAGAVTAFLADYYKENRPIITIVEPENANCLYRTVLAADGKLHNVDGDLQSIMAGLCCGEPCSLGWEMLNTYADNFISMPDEAAAVGMRVLGNPLAGDVPIISGESGAAGVGLLASVLRYQELASLKEKLQLDSNSIVLCISTEGDTDKENYRRIVWDGKYGV